MPPPRASAILLALAAASSGACRRRETPPPPPRASTSRPAAAASRETYRPPSDGRLAPQQVEMYLSVLDRVRLEGRKGGAAGPLAPGDALNLVPPDVVAARERGVSVEEYLWVKERVLEAEAAFMTARLDSSVLAMYERTVADLKARRAAAPDEPSRQLLSEQLAQFTAEIDRTRREAREKEPDAVRANMKTIEPLRSRLAAAGEALELPAAALLKEPPGPKDKKETP